jgi:acyl-CoA reductase-like NAD-dependent aldehyde dehydrogenase
VKTVTSLRDASVIVGDPKSETTMGPLANKPQFEKVNRLIARGVEEGTTVVGHWQARCCTPAQVLMAWRVQRSIGCENRSGEHI